MKDENLMPLSGKVLPKVFVFALLLAAGGCMSDSDFMPGDAYIPPASGNTQDYAENPMDVGSETDLTSPVLDPFDPYDPSYGNNETDNMSDLSSSGNEDESEVLIVEEEESSDKTSVSENDQPKDKDSSKLKPTDSVSSKATLSTDSDKEEKPQTTSTSTGNTQNDN